MTSSLSKRGSKSKEDLRNVFGKIYYKVFDAKKGCTKSYDDMSGSGSLIEFLVDGLMLLFQAGLLENQRKVDKSWAIAFQISTLSTDGVLSLLVLVLWTKIIKVF